MITFNAVNFQPAVKKKLKLSTVAEEKVHDSGTMGKNKDVKAVKSKTTEEKEPSQEGSSHDSETMGKSKGVEIDENTRREGEEPTQEGSSISDQEVQEEDLKTEESHMQSESVSNPTMMNKMESRERVEDSEKSEGS